MAEVLMEFPQLTMSMPDGREESIMKRTCLVGGAEHGNTYPVCHRVCMHGFIAAAVGHTLLWEAEEELLTTAMLPSSCKLC